MARAKWTATCGKSFVAELKRLHEGRPHIGMRERVIAPIILILTLRGPRRQAGPVIPNSGDVRGCMRVGLLSVTGFPVSLSSAGQSSRASCRPHGVAKALPACCG